MNTKLLQSLDEIPDGLALQLALSHSITAGLTIWLVTGLSTAPAGIATPLVLALAGLFGLLLTANLQRSLKRLHITLARLATAQAFEPVNPLAHWPLGRLFTRLEGVAHEQQTGDLRRALLQQTEEAAAQAERNRLARELHDSIKQQIFGIHIGAAAVQARWESDRDGAWAALADVRESARAALVEMNAMLQQLAPAPLEQVGLVQALRDQCEALELRTGAQIRAEIGELPDDERLPVGAQETLFRIVQEALSNIARHARAQQVTLRLHQSAVAEELVLEIEDDGQGFDSEAATNGMGLSNIRQRAQSLDGKTSLHSQRGAGTILRISIPLVELIIFQENLMNNYKADHTLNRIFVTGLAGGVALLAALYYPLYVLLPARYVPGWVSGSEALGLVFQALAAALMIGIGYTTARWARFDTRTKNLLAGGAAGAIAGLVMYYGLGGAAAGVLGFRPILEFGRNPAGETGLAKLTAEAVVDVIWWTQLTFWAVLLAGIGLGALGGWFAPPAAQPRTVNQWGLYQVASSMIVMAALINVLVLVVYVVIYGLLEPALVSSISEVGLSPESLHTTFPLNGVSILPMATPSLLLIGSVIAAYFLLRAQGNRMDDPAQLNQTIASSFAIAAGGVMLSIMLWLIVEENFITQSWGIVVVIDMIAGLAFGGLFATLGIKLRQRRQTNSNLQLPLSSAQHNLSDFGLMAYMVLFVACMWLGTMIDNPGLMMLVFLLIGAAMVFYSRRKYGPLPAEVSAITHQSINLQVMVSMIPGTIVGFVTLGLVGIPSALNLVLLVVPALVPLHGEAAAVGSLVELVQTSYLVHAQALLGTFIVALIGAGMMTLGAAGVVTLMRRRKPTGPVPTGG